MRKVLERKLSCIIILISILLYGCRKLPHPTYIPAYESGRVSSINDTFGTYFLYVPKTVRPKNNILVLIHGTPGRDEWEVETARYYIESWVGFAEENGIILITPVFDHMNFSSRDIKLEVNRIGYRGLSGREIGADDWVINIVDSIRRNLAIEDNGISLYGHSAGGQFVSRFMVTHPEMINQAVITSAATYPQPDRNIPWPYGMGELHTHVEWWNDIRKEDVIPEAWKWAISSQIPLTIIVGMNDAEIPSERTGQDGTTRYIVAKNWIREMTSFAEGYGLGCNFQLELIPGKGHSMIGLIDYSQAALVEEQVDGRIQFHLNQLMH